jgi:hypothetical protein
MTQLMIILGGFDSLAEEQIRVRSLGTDMDRSNLIPPTVMSNYNADLPSSQSLEAQFFNIIRDAMSRHNRSTDQHARRNVSQLTTTNPDLPDDSDCL